MSERAARRRAERERRKPPVPEPLTNVRYLHEDEVAEALDRLLNRCTACGSAEVCERADGSGEWWCLQCDAHGLRSV